MNYRPFLGTVAVLFFTSVFGWSAATISINFDSGVGEPLLTNGSGIALSAGTSADGDGDVIQLGYYTGATLGNNFSGTWVPLTGEGSLNTGTIPGSSPAEKFNQTSIGDQSSTGVSNGQFSLSLTFIAGDAATGNSFPLAGTPLSIRIYNSTTTETSTLFNAVSDNATNWLWETPAGAPLNPVLNISLSNSGLVWQGGSSTAFKTALAVPEPASLSLALFGGIAMLIRRRRSVASLI